MSYGQIIYYHILKPIDILVLWTIFNKDDLLVSKLKENQLMVSFLLLFLVHYILSFF
jgi:hypothetical protein